MPRFHVAVLSLVIAAAAAACGSSGASPSSPPSAVAPASAPASAAPTASPNASAAASVSSAGVQAITLSEWKATVASTLKAGTTNFAITNMGTEPHELLVFKSDLDPSAYPTDAAGDIKEDGGGVLLVSDGENINPGASQARTVDLTPGKYLFVCNIPGHFKQGMFTVVTVTP